MFHPVSEKVYEIQRNIKNKNEEIQKEAMDTQCEWVCVSVRQRGIQMY